jgi:hypothetical protein
MDGRSAIGTEPRVWEKSGCNMYSEFPDFDTPIAIRVEHATRACDVASVYCSALRSPRTATGCTA